MVVLNPALLSLLLPAAVLARPNQHEKFHHKRHCPTEDCPEIPDIMPGGIHGGPPLVHPTGAPYPTGNSTTVGPTGTGTGVSSSSQPIETITSIISVVPVPPGEMSGGSPPSSAGPPGHGGPGGEGSPSGPGDDVCGPATVTVTSAKTVTVTVPGEQKQSPPPAAPVEHQQAPVEHQKTPESPHKPKAPVVPKPQEHVTPPAGKPEHKPEHKAVHKPAPEANASPAEQTAPKAGPQEKPKEAPKAAPQPKVEHPENSPIAPKVENKAAKAPEQPKKEQPKQSPKTTPAGEKKGILYKTLDSATAMSGHVSWGCNWDSSPIPAVGHASGSLGGMDFVPQLWGTQQVHLDVWPGNSKGANYVMAFNEPNQPQGAGGCGPMQPSDAIGPYEQYLGPNKKAGQKIISPCVSNEAHDWLETFISGTSLKPDAVCFHWYGMNLQELQGVVSNFADIQAKHGIPELWMTEWALNADISTSDMTELLDWLDNESGVNKYAYNNEKLETTPQVKQAYCGGS